MSSVPTSRRSSRLAAKQPVGVSAPVAVAVAVADPVFSPIPIANPETSKLEYPFSFIAEYDPSEFAEGLLDEVKGDPGNFPDNITEFYWIHEGENDEDAWECLCKLDNGYYAFYSAWCDYTGFDCQGSMKLIIGKNLSNLFHKGLTEAQQMRYMNDTNLKM